MQCSRETCYQLASALKGNAILKGDAMRDYFKQNIQDTVETHISASKNGGSIDCTKAHNQTYRRASLELQPIGTPTKQSLPLIRLCDENVTALAKFNQMLTLKAYSPNTITAYYTSEFRLYLQTLGNTTAESLATIVVSG